MPAMLLQQRSSARPADEKSDEALSLKRGGASPGSPENDVSNELAEGTLLPPDKASQDATMRALRAEKHAAEATQRAAKIEADIDELQQFIAAKSDVGQFLKESLQEQEAQVRSEAERAAELQQDLAGAMDLLAEIMGKEERQLSERDGDSSAAALLQALEELKGQALALRTVDDKLGRSDKRKEAACPAEGLAVQREAYGSTGPVLPVWKRSVVDKSDQGKAAIALEPTSMAKKPTGDSKANDAFRPGDRVRVRGLLRDPDLNGQVGRVVRQSGAHGVYRWTVLLPDQEARTFDAENLELAGGRGKNPVFSREATVEELDGQASPGSVARLARNKAQQIPYDRKIGKTAVQGAPRSTSATRTGLRKCTEENPPTSPPREYSWHGSDAASSRSTYYESTASSAQSEPSRHNAAASQSKQFKVGDAVQLHGTTRADLNGLQGFVDSWKDGKVVVAVDQSRYLLKASNLKPSDVTVEQKVDVSDEVAGDSCKSTRSRKNSHAPRGDSVPRKETDAAQKEAKKEGDGQADGSDDDEFHPGLVVKLIDLKSDAGKVLNDRIGIVVERKGNRYAVDLDGVRKLFRPRNLMSLGIVKKLPLTSPRLSSNGDQADSNGNLQRSARVWNAPCQGTASSTERNETTEEKKEYEVVLHIYDVSEDPRVTRFNNLARVMGTGAFHAGVEIDGMEWSFGANDETGRSGVYNCDPKQNSAHIYREAVTMGTVTLTKSELKETLKKLSEEWPGRSYDLLNHNCCHFSDEMCRDLGVGPTPPWVTNLANTSEGLLKAAAAVRERHAPKLLQDARSAVDFVAEKAEQIEQKIQFADRLESLAAKEISIDESYVEKGLQDFWARAVESVEHVGALAERAIEEVQKPVDVTPVEASVVDFWTRTVKQVEGTIEHVNQLARRPSHQSSASAEERVGEEASPPAAGGLFSAMTNLWSGTSQPSQLAKKEAPGQNEGDGKPSDAKSSPLQMGLRFEGPQCRGQTDVRGLPTLGRRPSQIGMMIRMLPMIEGDDPVPEPEMDLFCGAGACRGARLHASSPTTAEDFDVRTFVYQHDESCSAKTFLYDFDEVGDSPAHVARVPSTPPLPLSAKRERCVGRRPAPVVHRATAVSLPKPRADESEDEMDELTGEGRSPRTSPSPMVHSPRRVPPVEQQDTEDVGDPTQIPSERRPNDSSSEEKHTVVKGYTISI
eukprot:TRINITY_DN50325_c0_g1_i1.p1 TRINITY_DN50325_c0_g1~~TRINITY_DN50325_c0_g1_i1.p1  ORF type:complete len:1189 (+),score=255.11 TRINITY_DN50325_c0_g1_i1:119-3685(+)